MAEVLAEFPDILTTTDGDRYRAQACGAATVNGTWEGWIEFIPLDDGEPIRSPRETTQPNHTDMKYWATGLTRIYLEGALTRALAPPAPPLPGPGTARFGGPAVTSSRRPAAAPGTEAILDPFSVYEKGESLLRKELSALSAWHLVNVIVAYRLSDMDAASLNLVPATILADLIVESVRTRAPVR